MSSFDEWDNQDVELPTMPLQGLPPILSISREPSEMPRLLEPVWCGDPFVRKVQSFYTNHSTVIDALGLLSFTLAAVAF